MNKYFSLLRRGEVGCVVLSDAVSVLGDQIGWVALLWFVMTLSGHSSPMGLLALCFGIPGVVSGSFAGTLLDKWSRKWTLILTNILLGCVFSIIPVLFKFGYLPMWLLFALVSLAGLLAPVTTIGSLLILPSLMSREELPVANALTETLWQTATLVGPLFGGVLIAQFGAPVAVFFDGLTFWVAALLLTWIREDRSTKRDMPKGTWRQSHFWSDARQGFSYLFNTKSVLWITVVALFMNMAYGQLEVSLPLFVHRELMLSAVTLGLLWTAYSVGSILGASAYGLIKPPKHQGIVMICMVIAWGASLLPMIWLHHPWVTLVCMGLAGFTFAVYPPMARTMVQLIVPTELQGRVFGIRSSFIGMGVPLGSYLSGLASNWLHPSTIVGFTGGAVILFGILVSLVKEFSAL